MTDPTLDPRFTAAIDLIGRTGASDWQIRYADDEQPTVWMAVAKYPDGRWDAAAGTGPVRAALRLCDQLIDGGKCVHCGRPAMFHADLDTNPTPLDPLFCSYEWDPELRVFRRSCE